jgi:hypothetical protein
MKSNDTIKPVSIYKQIQFVLRIEECKNHSHTLKLKNLEVLFINDCWNLGYMYLNSSWRN